MPTWVSDSLPLPSPVRPAKPLAAPAPAARWAALLERWALRPAVPAAGGRRVFVVGCERSGTTVLQLALARRAGLLTVPETHFFARLLGASDDWVQGDVAGSRLRWLRRLLLARQGSARAARHALAALPEAPAARRHLSGRGYVHDFIAHLDRLAQRHGASGWLEKTPGHFVFIEPLARLCPDARFVHVLRAGEDVVASAVDAEMRYAGHDIFHGGAMRWVQRWNRAAETHLYWAGHPSHHVVFHEDLVADPERVLGRVLRFLGAEAARPRDTGPGELADLRREPWKREAISGRIAARASRFDAVFGPEARRLVREALVDYGRLQEAIRSRQA